MRNRIVIALLTSSFLQIAPAQTRRAVSPRTPKTTGVDPGSPKDLAVTFHGTLKFLDSKEIVLDTTEGQSVVIRRSRKTRFLIDAKEARPSQITLGAQVSVDAVQDVDLKPTALSLTLHPPAKE